MGRLAKRIVIKDGTVTTLYDDKTGPKIMEALGGKACIRRASHVEAPEGLLEKIEFQADLRPSGGPILKGFPSYQAAVQAEVDWINENVLGKSPRKPKSLATNQTTP